MSIRIEVTGASIPEMADKLLAIGRSLHNTCINDADDAAREELQAKRRKPKAEKPVEEPQPDPVIEGAVLEPEPEPEPEPAVEEPQPVVLDFEKDVTPVVLAGVKQRGKPWIQDILAQFGVERASQVPDERLAELVSIIKDGLE